MKPIALSAIIAAVIAGPASAVYKCVDSSGKTAYQNDPCQNGKSTTLDVQAQPKRDAAGALPVWARDLTPAEKAVHDEKIRRGAEGTLSGNMNTAEFQSSMLEVRIGMHDLQLLRIDPRFLTWAKTRQVITARGITEWRTYQNGTTLTLTNSVVTAISH